MNLLKFLSVAILLTVVALAYVHQQVELVRINYTLNHNLDNLADLLDQNSVLVYNVNNLQTPVYLEKSLSAKKLNLEVPSRWYAIGMAEAAR